MRRQCYTAQVTAPFHHQIFTNDREQVVETLLTLLRASQTSLQETKDKERSEVPC